MRLVPILLAFLVLHHASADFGCSRTYKIPNENKLHFQECAPGKIRIDSVHSKPRVGFDIEVHPNISFNIVHPNYPEGNTIWSVHSPDEKTAVVYVENSEFERNAWVIDMPTKEIKLFTDHAQGRHFKVEFDGNEQFRIIHAGMGYRTDCVFERVRDSWVQTGCYEME